MVLYFVQGEWKPHEYRYTNGEKTAIGKYDVL